MSALHAGVNSFGQLTNGPHNGQDISLNGGGSAVGTGGGIVSARLHVSSNLCDTQNSLGNNNNNNNNNSNNNSMQQQDQVSYANLQT